jgi:hypothetical protein
MACAGLPSALDEIKGAGDVIGPNQPRFGRGYVLRDRIRITGSSGTAHTSFHQEA